MLIRDLPDGQAAVVRVDIHAVQISRWRGFNLPGTFDATGKAHEERDFAITVDWGFDFVRWLSRIGHGAGAIIGL
jgi:hypothetical protein